MIRTLLAILFILTSFSAHAGLTHKWGQPIWNLTCEGVLLPISKMAKPNHVALNSLRDIIGFAHELSARDDKEPKYGPLALTEINAQNAADIRLRWRWIEKELIKVEDGKFAAGYEIRGEENIRQALIEVEQEHKRLTELLDKTLRESLPPMRRANWGRIVNRLAIAPFLIAGIYYDPTFFTAAVAVAGMLYYSDYKNLKQTTDADYYRFVQTMKSNLSNPQFKTAYAYGNDFFTSTNYGKELIANLGNEGTGIKPDVQRRASVSKAMKFDDLWAAIHFGREHFQDKDGLYIGDLWDNHGKDAVARAAAEGLNRQSAIDQIFYRDPKTNEPVWLIFFRSDKNIVRPKKPNQKAEEEQQENWAQGLLPQPVPIPVPVKDR